MCLKGDVKRFHEKEDSWDKSINEMWFYRHLFLRQTFKEEGKKERWKAAAGLFPGLGLREHAWYKKVLERRTLFEDQFIYDKMPMSMAWNPFETDFGKLYFFKTCVKLQFMFKKGSNLSQDQEKRDMSNCLDCFCLNALSMIVEQSAFGSMFSWSGQAMLWYLLFVRKLMSLSRRTGWHAQFCQEWD